MGDVVDSGEPDALRHEILRLRDELSGATSRREVLDDRVAELERQVEAMAAEIERLATVTANPAVRVLIAATRPFRRLAEGRSGRR